MCVCSATYGSLHSVLTLFPISSPGTFISQCIVSKSTTRWSNTYNIVCMYFLVYSPLVATSFLPEFPGAPGDLWGDLGQKPLQTTVNEICYCKTEFPQFTQHILMFYLIKGTLCIERNNSGFRGVLHVHDVKKAS